MTTEAVELPTYKRQDFMSDQEVRWCPGCGDYSILAQMQKILPDIGVLKENVVFISGIGCSSRFPYYMDTYGIHSIHGRAPTLATGLAIANPELSVWVITGDGDGLSIGGNHLIHACRRNINLNIILFNNRVYGLTKGQYSPTSRVGYRSKSSPMGSLDRPINPLSLALAAEATFIARTIDTQVKHLAQTLKQAAAHKGTSFVEVYQNCLIFNPDEWTELNDRKIRDDNILFLEEGKPMVFGKNDQWGIKIGANFEPEVFSLTDNVDSNSVQVHRTTPDSPHLSYWLTRLERPVPFGIFRQIERPSYSDGLTEQVKTAQKAKGTGDLNKLYRAGDIWKVTEGNGKNP